ncbi:MAG: endonuclease MutS2 [Candidatus Auribacterota bacterium]|jgi:DNA mismatch repair protein MutS2|nr:endonuclease MutS2 [Candidatus Auribacterota bacterium]
MDKHTLGVLEFDQIKQIIADRTSSELGKIKILSAQPSGDFGHITRATGQLRDMMELLADVKSIPGTGVPDISDIVEKFHIEGVILDTEGFLALWRFLSGARHIKKFLVSCENPIPALKELAEQIESPNRLEKAISFVFTEDGKIKDTASQKLKTIRKEIRSIRKSILSKLSSIIEKNRSHECLYNDQITIREGRYVLFVKSQHRHVIDGVIHDKSISGATCFVEPASIIEQGNRLRALRFDERNEILRIKRFLSSLVREHLDMLKSMLEPVAQCEFLAAAAQFGLYYGMVSPHFSGGHDFSLVDGYHPLLLTRIGSRAVPVTTQLNNDARCLIITGPNMGGKTVALKTVGLLCLMAQSGLPVPVKTESVFPVYESIFADIGDEQSIENDTSTFSSHISRISQILRHDKPDTLVLIDEFGTGTDPEEGSALAIAILEQLIKQKKFVIANTHLFRLKQFAASVKGVRNASMLFDGKTNLPTYQLVMDIPGSSNALETAENLGLSKSIINRAHTLLGKDPDTITALTRDLHAERLRLQEEIKKYSYDRETASVLANRYKNKLMKFEEEKERTLKSKLSEMESFIKQIKKDFETAVGEMKFVNEAKLKDTRRKWESFHRQIQTQQAQFIDDEPQLPDDDMPDIEEKPPAKPYTGWKQGDTVRVAPFNFEGKILSVNEKKKRAVVLSENRKIEASLKDLTIIAPAQKQAEINEPASTSPKVSFHIHTGARGSFNPTLDLRGEYVERGIELLEKHLSDVLLYGFKQFTVIHGFGTGKMKKAVREFLRSHPQVTSIRDGGASEGGLGVTVADL